MMMLYPAAFARQGMLALEFLGKAFVLIANLQWRRCCQQAESLLVDSRQGRMDTARVIICSKTTLFLITA